MPQSNAARQANTPNTVRQSDTPDAQMSHTQSDSPLDTSSNAVHTSIPRRDLFRFEHIAGQIVAMAPGSESHSTVSGNIHYLLKNFLRNKPCRAYIEGPMVYLTDDDRFIPDVMVVCDRDKVRRDGIHGAPDLVIEVLSPSTARHDRGHKMRTYALCGVREYWIVNPREKSVEQYVLRDGAFDLSGVYAKIEPWELADRPPEYTPDFPTSFHCAVFPQLEVSLDDVFADLLE